MATTRPATPPVSARRLLVVRDVVRDVVVDVGTGSADVEGVVTREVGVGSVLLAVVDVDRAVDLAVVVVAAEEGVRGGTEVGLGAAVGATRAEVDVVGVSGSKVRALVAGSVESSAGTVTSGTPGTVPVALDPAVVGPGTERPVLSRTGRGVGGEDWSTAAPQAAISTAAMP